LDVLYNMANAVNRDAICNCLFRYLAQNKDCYNRTDVIDKIASIINRSLMVVMFRPQAEFFQPLAGLTRYMAAFQLN